MALNVIDLLSSDEDENESPNKKARSALDSFAPRKDRVSGKNNVTGRRNLEDAEDFESPEKAARSALSSFAPRKDRRAEKGGLPDWNGERGEEPLRGVESPEKDARSALNGFLPRRERKRTFDLTQKHGQHTAHTNGHPSSRPNVPESVLNGLPAPHRSASAAHSPLHRQAHIRSGLPAHASKGAARKRNHLPDFGPSGTTRFTQPEEGSLVALLQNAQESTSTPPIGRRSKTPDDRVRRADAYYKERLKNSPGGRLSNGLQDCATSPVAEESPRFKFPTGRPPARPQATLQRGPLEIVDLFENKKPEASITTTPVTHETITRPMKRPRLSSPVISDDGTSARNSPLSSSKKRAKPWHTQHKTLLHPLERRDVPALQSTGVDAPPSVAPSSPKPQSTNNASSPSNAVSTHERAGKHEHAELRKNTGEEAPLPAMHAVNGASSNFGNQYTPEEDELLAELKEVRNVRWEDMVPYFQGRTKGSLQVRYSSKVSKRHQHRDKAVLLSKPQRSSPLVPDAASDSATANDARPRRKRRNGDVSAASGMISWFEISRRRQQIIHDSAETSPAPVMTKVTSSAQFSGERAHPKSLYRILRHRELGSCARDGSRNVPDELKEQLCDDVGPVKFYKGTSGDVTCVAWSPDGRHFAAGSIAISDERSMQYNRPGNLLIGDFARSCLRELPEHYVPRPAIAATSGNVNALHAMRESQDPRLFMTVASVQFSPDSGTLYSAGTDAKVRAYDVTGDQACSYAIDHPAPLDLLSVSNSNLLATACHQSADGSIAIYDGAQHLYALSPSRAEQQTNRAIFPSALRWGISHHHSNLLLAGFSIDSIDEERDIAGETCLWDVVAEKRIPVPVTRNVFDIAWNPRPTSTSTVFAIASTPGTQKVSKGTRTVVQCFAPNQGRASRVLEWESPAFDINDVVYCQHDDNLIAAGATDGKVYVWDQRFAGRRPTPLHVLEHGDTLNVVDHDRAREITDTGVRFLSWGATSTRLYTGSSDGVVKVWNPYMATENAHIKDVATFGSAVMSGAFSPDYRDLLIGEDQGRINALSIGHGEKAVRSMRKFDFVPAPAPEMQQDRNDAAHQLILSQQIMLRPMGDLPVRQAVQGPKYAGPYLMPTAEEMESAQHMYNIALNTQSDAHARSSMLDDDTTLQAACQADQQATQAADAIAKLQSRIEDATSLYPQAEANQLNLHKAEKQRLKLEASLSRALECCKLDCNYLPANVEDGEVADSSRSEGRIPGNLRKLPRQDTSLLTPQEVMEAGLTSRCISCSSPAAKPKAGLPLCEFCATTRRGLTAKCADCSAPIRPQTDANDSSRCESCSFACFRCGEAAVVSRDRSHVSCSTCRLTWKAGVLGYELVSSSKKSKSKIRQRSGRNMTVEEGLEFGENEMEHYAARWGSNT